MELHEATSGLQPNDAETHLARALAQLDRERKAVGEIQLSLLPASLPEIPGFEMSSYYRPSELASGDYYDVVPLIEDRWGFVMADVAGHGTPAAVIMAVMRTLIHAELPTNRDKSAGEFLERVNGVMSETYLREGLFVTMWAAVLDPSSRQLTYASAGHNPPRLLRGGHVSELSAACGIPLGIDPTATYDEGSVTLQPEDLLVIYTDGITETMRSGIGGLELFGTKRLDRVLSECGSDQTSVYTERVTKALTAFTRGAAPTDDQTMLILRAGGFASERMTQHQSVMPCRRLRVQSSTPVTTRPCRQAAHVRDRKFGPAEGTLASRPPITASDSCD
jgi:sigma-B regulation protein RsbU (phosphoserine phosphatase)